ncbi:MAG TPA: FlgD immunoglobulin-like domain containing protein, partial [Chloroflexota bacterium]
MMRYLVAFVILVGGAAAGLFAYRHFTAGIPVVLPKPTLQVTASGTSLLPGGWTNSPWLELRAVRSGVVAGVDIEIRKQGVKFKDTPTVTENPPGQVAANCTSCVAMGAALVRLHLNDGPYHLQARFHNKQGVSPWVRYYGLINVDTTPPAAAQIASSTDPNPVKTYHSSTLQFSWQDGDAGSGIAGYSYRLDSDAGGTARQELRTNGTSVVLHGLNTGTWYFHVRALDRAGNWGPNVTFPVHIDVTPPGLTHVRFNLFQMDPQFDRLRVSFSVTRPASTVRIGVYRQSDGAEVRMYQLTNLQKGQQTQVAWDGKDAQGRLAA